MDWLRPITSKFKPLFNLPVVQSSIEVLPWLLLPESSEALKPDASLNFDHINTLELLNNLWFKQPLPLDLSLSSIGIGKAYTWKDEVIGTKIKNIRITS